MHWFYRTASWNFIRTAKWLALLLILVPLVETELADNTGQHTNFAEGILMVVGYIRCADSENGLIFAELALVFEINAFFMEILFA